MFFIPLEFNRMKERCPDERDELLRQLNIPISDFAHFNDNDYTSLNKKIYQKICEMMDSQSDIEGYEKLLKLGGMERNNDTRRDCIARIVANREKILQSNSPTPEVKLSCNFASRETFKTSTNLINVLRNFIEKLFSGSSRPERVTLIARKREIKLNESVAQKIKNIITKELGDDIGEIVISILPARYNLFFPAIQNLDKTLDILAQVNKINDKIYNT